MIKVALAGVGYAAPVLKSPPPFLRGEIGSGWGRRMWEHALESARAAGFTRLRIDADPHAEGFYLAMGAVRVGQTESRAAVGRMLPLLEVTIRNHGAV